MRWATFWRVTQPTQLVFQIPLFLWYFGGNFWKQFCLRYSLSISGTLRLNQSDFSLFTSGFNFVPCRPWYHLLNWGFDVLEIVEKFCDFSWLYFMHFLVCTDQLSQLFGIYVNSGSKCWCSWGIVKKIHSENGGKRSKHLSQNPCLGG